MANKKQKLLIRIRFLFLGTLLAVVLLSAESLLTKQEIFKNFALGLIVAGLFVISLLTAKAICIEDD